MPSASVKNHHRCEAPRLAQAAQTVAHIRDEIFNRCPLPHCARILFGQRHVAELAAGHGLGVLVRHSARHQLLDLLLKVRTNLVRQFPLHSPPRKPLFHPVHRSPHQKTTHRAFRNS
jgi:hypothetical protein